MASHTFALALHVLAATLWVGGMFFAHQVLRPVAANQLQPPARLTLWVSVFNRFFPWVWLFVAILPLTGYWMIFELFGGMGAVGLYVHIMQGLGWVMILIYMHVFFAPFRRLKDAVVTEDWPEAGRRLGQIRQLVGVNLTLGLVVIAVASGGRLFAA